jgi:hypothetical protein
VGLADKSTQAPPRPPGRRRERWIAPPGAGAFLKENQGRTPFQK